MIVCESLKIIEFSNQNHLTCHIRLAKKSRQDWEKCSANGSSSSHLDYFIIFIPFDLQFKCTYVRVGSCSRIGVPNWKSH